MAFGSWLKEFAQRLKSPISIIGLAIIIFYIGIALLAPVIAPPGHPTQGGDPFKMPHEGSSMVPKPPSEKHPFGTTRTQYDLYYGCIWGTISAFRVGLLVIFGIIAIGLLIGPLAGYFGGVADELVMRFTDIFLSLPGIILVMLLATAIPYYVSIPLLFPKGITRMDAVLLALVLVGWPSYTRIVRNETFRIKHGYYTKTSESDEHSNIGATAKHKALDLLYPLLIMPLLEIGPVVLIAATLSFLSLGPPEGYADWGQLIAFSRDYIIGSPLNPYEYWYTYVIPGLFLFTFALGWVLLSEGLRDIFDPVRARAFAGVPD